MKILARWLWTGTPIIKKQEYFVQIKYVPACGFIKINIYDLKNKFIDFEVMF